MEFGDISNNQLGKTLLYLVSIICAFAAFTKIYEFLLSSRTRTDFIKMLLSAPIWLYFSAAIALPFVGTFIGNSTYMTFITLNSVLFLIAGILNIQTRSKQQEKITLELWQIISCTAVIVFVATLMIVGSGNSR